MSNAPTFVECAAAGTITVTTVHQNTDLRDYATRRAQQLEELLQLAGDCGDDQRAVIVTLVEEIGRETAALLRAIACDEVRHV